MFGKSRKVPATSRRLKALMIGETTWKKGNHVMIYGDYKALSPRFKPSVRTPLPPTDRKG